MSAGAGFTVRTVSASTREPCLVFFRVYRSSVLRRGLRQYGDRLIQERGFACKAEILAKLERLGARIEEVPVDLDGSRRNGDSKMRVVRDDPRVLADAHPAASRAGVAAVVSRACGRNRRRRHPRDDRRPIVWRRRE